MATTSTPSYSESNVIAIATLARNATSRGTLDLRAKFGAWLLMQCGRTGTNALTTGVIALVRRTLNNDGRRVPGAFAHYATGQATAAISTTCAASGNNAGVTSLTVAATTSFVVGDILLVENGSDQTASEFVRVARITSSTVFLLDAPTQFAHNSTSHTVRNKADCYAVWLDGGATYEVVFDYGSQAAGDTVVIEATAQVHDSVGTA